MKDEYGTHYMIKIVKHLQENPHITTATVELLEECSRSKLQSTEQKWFNHYLHNEQVLNYGFTARPDPVRHKPQNSQVSTNPNTKEISREMMEKIKVALSHT